MSTRRHLFRLLSVALALAVAACGVDSPQPTGAVSQGVQESPAELSARVEAERVRTTKNALASLRSADSINALLPAIQIGGISITGTVDGLVNATLLHCRALPYASDVKVIGPWGGQLRIGPHRLTIPPGALDKNVVITGESPVSELAQVKLSPHGLKFNKRYRPVLTLSYEHCSSLDLAKRIVYVDDLLKLLEVLTSFDYSQGKVVIAPLSHFSSYVVAY